jgi:hypothetical protein
MAPAQSAQQEPLPAAVVAEVATVHRDVEAARIAWWRARIAAPLAGIKASNEEQELLAEWLGATSFRGWPALSAIGQQWLQVTAESGSLARVLALCAVCAAAGETSWEQRRPLADELLTAAADQALPPWAREQAARTARHCYRGRNDHEGVRAASRLLISAWIALADRQQVADGDARVWAERWFDTPFTEQGEDERDQWADAFTAAVLERRGEDDWLARYWVGCLEIKRAWWARGNGWASSVSKDGWRGFADHLAVAHRHLSAAHALAPQRPEAARRLITVAMAGHSERDERYWFEQAVAAQVDHMQAYHNLCWSLYPRWGGSHEQMIALGQEALAGARFDTWAPMFYSDAMRRVTSDLSQAHRRGKNKGDGDLNMLDHFRAPGVSQHLDRLYDGYSSVIAGTDGWRLEALMAEMRGWNGDYAAMAAHAARAEELAPESGIDVTYGWHGRGLTYSNRAWALVREEVDARSGPHGPALAVVDARAAAGDRQGAQDALLALLQAKDLDPVTHTFVMRWAVALANHQPYQEQGGEDPLAWAYSKHQVKALAWLLKNDVLTLDSEVGGRPLLAAALADGWSGGLAMFGYSGQYWRLAPERLQALRGEITAVHARTKHKADQKRYAKALAAIDKVLAEATPVQVTDEVDDEVLF